MSLLGDVFSGYRTVLYCLSWFKYSILSIASLIMVMMIQGLIHLVLRRMVDMGPTSMPGSKTYSHKKSQVLSHLFIPYYDFNYLKLISGNEIIQDSSD